ncbi:c-type cytochrome [Marinobacter sp. CA1]|nr:c-type cytochrome [Marinobacter sp. CA1]
MVQRNWFYGLIIGCFGLASMAHAESTVNEAMAKVNQILGNPELHEASYQAGLERITFCASCHGKDGNSKRDYIPNLAAQHPLYLFEQFEKFADGTREDYVMSRLAKILTLEDRINIAVYYSEQEARARQADNAGQVEAGAEVFASVCTNCHGRAAEGFRNMPRLAGQPAEYVRNALNRFQDMDPASSSSPMIGIASGLSEDDIAAVATYLQTL